MGNKVVDLQPGQFVFGRRSAVKELPLSEQEIRTCLKTLQKLGNLTISSTHQFTIISITNWDIYQSEQEEINPQPNPEATHDQPTINHKQECKNLRSKEIQKTSSSQVELDDAALPLAMLLRDLINARSNGTPIVPEKTNMQTWAKEIDRMIRLDERTQGQIESVIRFCQRDNFWQSNILSAKKLREKFPQLYLKMNSENQKNGQQIEYPKGMKAL